MLGTLYIVATPIGNLEDITLRAIKILSQVDLILAEDTRITKKLVDLLSSAKNSYSELGSPIQSSIISYHQHSGEAKKLEILNNLLDGKNIALVTDAGTPGISDPGNELIDFLLSYQPEAKVVPIPGATGLTTALSVCGFDISKFLFLGFWPKKKLGKVITLIKLAKVPFAFYESPHRLIKTLRLIEDSFGKDIRVMVARELTKMYETLYRGRVNEVIARIENDKIRGEIVVVVEY